MLLKLPNQCSFPKERRKNRRSWLFQSTFFPWFQVAFHQQKMFYKIVTRNLIPSGRVARKDHHCKGTSWLPPTFGRLTSSLQPTSWCPKVPSPLSEIRQGFFGLIIQINQWLLISPDHKAEVAGVKAGHGFMDLFLGLEATPRFECLVICGFQPFIFQGVIVLKHDNKKSQVLLVERGTRPKSGNFHTSKKKQATYQN